MATNTLGEFSDGEDDFVFEINENLGEWSDPEADDLIRNIDEDEVLAGVHGNDDDDDLIRNINEEEVLARVYGNDDDDDLIRNINEEEVLADMYGNDDNDDLIRSIDEDEVLAQMGRGEKRKSDDEEPLPAETGEYYYHIESVKKYYSKKFRMSATDHKVRFNNVLADFDLLESHESTQKIFHYLLEDVTEGMNPNDQVRFILRSDQLDTPISIPFLPVERLTTERVFLKSSVSYSRIRSFV